MLITYLLFEEIRMAGLELASKTKSFIGYAIGGILFFIIAGSITGLYASFVGFDGQNGIAEFTNAIVSFQLEGILFGLGLFFILGALAMVFAIATVKIRQSLFHDDNTKIKFVKKRFLLPLIGVGLATFIVLAVIGQIATGIADGLDLANPSTLLDAVVTFNIGALVGVLILYALTGFGIVWVAKREPAIEDVADKTKLNKI